MRPVMEDVQTALLGIEQPAFAADASGRLRAFNGPFLELLSLDASSELPAAALAWQDCLGGEGATHWMRGIEQGQGFGHALRPFKALGRWRYRATPVFDPARGARWLVTLSRESLDEPLDGNLIRLSLHAAVRAGRMGLWEWNPQTGDSLWSPEMYDVLRLPRGSGLEPGARFLALIHPEDLGKIDAAVAAAPARGGIDPFVFRVNAGDGSLRWIMSCSRAAHERGEPFTRLVGVNFDVTDTVDAELRLEAERLERARQEQVMRAVMEYAPVGIAVALQGEETLAYVSRFGAGMIKATHEQARSWPAWVLRHPDTRAPVREDGLPLARACEGAVIRDEAWLLQALDGTLIPISCNAGPIHGMDGSVVGGAVVWHDVTPFKEAQRQRDLFLAAVSHELRTPLSAILAWAETLRRSSDPAMLERGLVAIARNVMVQSRLVDDLLDVTRIAAGKLAMTLVDEDLARVVRAAIDTVEPIAASAQVVLALDVAKEPLPVLADELRLRQAVWNLLTNAVKFSRSGGLVQVRLRAEQGQARLDVTDLGVGLEAADLARVFEQFWQGDARDSGRNGGLGLGLAIAMHIVRGHRGTLHAHSDGVGRGATFTLRMPLRAGA